MAGRKLEYREYYEKISGSENAGIPLGKALEFDRGECVYMADEHKNIDPRISELDIMYRILKQNGQAQKIRDLILQAYEVKGLSPDDPSAMAAIHTQIILDHRFVFLGQGSWGLKEWTQGKINRRNIAATVAAGNGTPVLHRSLQDALDPGEEDLDAGFDKNSAEDEEEWE